MQFLFLKMFQTESYKEKTKITQNLITQTCHFQYFGVYFQISFSCIRVTFKRHKYENMLLYPSFFT